MTGNKTTIDQLGWKVSLKKAGSSALAYGLGMFIGEIIIFGLFRLPKPLLESNLSRQIGVLLVGVIMAFIILAIGSGIGGYIGGKSLSVVRQGQKTRTYAWRSALTMAALFGPLVFLSLFITALYAYYYINQTPMSVFVGLFSIVGLLFGLLFGSIFGLITVRWKGLGWVILTSGIGFGIGGAGLGVGLYAYLASIVEGVLSRGAWWWFLLALFWFGASGGAMLGLIYHRLAKTRETDQVPAGRNWLAYIGCVGIIIILIFSGYVLRQAGKALVDWLAPVKANLSSRIVPQVTGTHWGEVSDISDLATIYGEVHDPDIAVNQDGVIGIVWSAPDGEATGIKHLSALWDQEHRSTSLGTPHAIPGSQSATTPSQIAVDGSGNAHIVWRDMAQVYYATCDSDGCSEAVELVAGDNLICTALSSVSLSDEELAGYQPDIAVNGEGEIMATWLDRSARQLYATWQSNEPFAESNPTVECVREQDIHRPDNVRLDGNQGGRFTMVLESAGNILTLGYTAGEWSSPEKLGPGTFPQVFFAQDDNLHYAWCDEQGRLVYRVSAQNELISELPCLNRPEIGVDSQGQRHVVWYSDLVVDNFDFERTSNVIYESILVNGTWSEPTIVSEISSPAQPSLSSNPGGTLFMVWNDDKPIGSTLLYTSQIQYSCQDDPPTGVAQAIFDVARSEKYRPIDQIVPYCQNRYGRLLFTPAPDPAFSDEPALPNGGFDDYNILINSAKFEVLFATMEYDEDKNQDSPGLILANGIKDLYNKVAANPENYPRGMTVKIVLGNPPRMDINTDLWRVLTDLRDAGLPEMVNEQIGWRLEIANYKGHMPHSHVKVLVIDGRTAVSTGFNYQYHHFPEDHPSGAGEGTVDLGVQVTGPAAQEVLYAFDQLWNNATQRYCSDLYAAYPLWQWRCEDTDAIVDHVPEVTRYYLADGETQAFSMLRSEALSLSDEQIARVLAKATERVDVMEAMFAMPLVCYLNHLFELCTIEQAMPYITSIIEAAENGAHVRLLLKMTPFLGTEAQIALEVMQDEIEKRGLEDRVEFRVFPVALHAKTFTVDNQVVIIGSQNLHYTAYWDGSGLVEHNLAVVDPQAVEDYQRVFDYWWAVAGER